MIGESVLIRVAVTEFEQGNHNIERPTAMASQQLDIGAVSRFSATVGTNLIGTAESKTKRVLVTGASGFVGRSVVAALVDAGVAVCAATRDPAPLPSSVDVAIVPDFKRTIDWNPIARGMDVVIHVAGLAHADYSDSPYGVFDRVNWIATQELARAAAAAGVNHFIYISSVRAQAGPSAPGILRESDVPRPTDHYGRSKLAAELAVHAAGVPFTILRPVAIYGPRAKGNIRTAVRLAASPLPLPLLGFRNRRSLLAIANLVSAILFVLNNAAAMNETFLIADPEPLSLAEVITILRQMQGRPRGLVKIPPTLLRCMLAMVNQQKFWARLGEELVVDTSKLQAIGWRPVVDTAEGLVGMLQSESAGPASNLH